MKLYELSQAYRDVEEALSTMDEDERKDGIALLQEIEANLEEKLLACARVARNIEVETEAIKAEEQRLANRRRALENNYTRLKEYMQQQMDVAGLEKTRDANFTVSMQKNPPSVRVVDEGRIPRRYYIEQEPKLDKRGILDALKAGESVDGVELQQTRSLRIR